MRQARSSLWADVETIAPLRAPAIHRVSALETRRRKPRTIRTDLSSPLDDRPTSGPARLIAALRERQAELVDEGVRAIQSSICAYGRVDDPAFVADVTAHLDKHHGAMLRSIAEGRALSHDEMLFVRPHATRRVGRVSLVDFMRSFRVYQQVVWRAALEYATCDESRSAALGVVDTILEYHNVAATHAGEIYQEAERLLWEQGERVRQDLVDDLLAGRLPGPGPKLAAVREAGLEQCAHSVVIVAVPTAANSEEHFLRSAATALVRALGTQVRPLTAVRRDEIVVIAPAKRLDASELDTALVAVQRRLAAQQLHLAVGVSTIQERLSGIPVAYREALGALERLGSEGGVVALPALRPFDYLTRFGHETVRRLVPAAVRRFVKEDLAEGGVLTSTLLEYVAVDLNVKAAAERLHLHANTAHYRLARIEERTGYDVRRLADVLDLVIAVQAAQSGPDALAA